MDTFLRAFTEGILLGGVYALIALGVVMVFKASKVFNLAHGGVLVFLAYFTWWLLVPKSLPLWLSLLTLTLVAVLFGLTLERLIFRPLIGQTMLVTFIITLVLGFTVIPGLATLFWGGRPQVMHVFPSGSMTIGPVTFSHTFLYSFIIAVAMFIIFVFYFRYTRTGLLMRCVSEDNLISQSLGINVKWIFALSWVVGCLSAAIGAILLGSMFAVNSDLGGLAIIHALPVVLLGGLESIPGAFIGALFVGLTETCAGTYVDPYVSGFRELMPYILMVLILMFRPHGLFGLRRIERI
jgi:branched-chain amino acid transport system permease protein